MSEPIHNQERFANVHPDLVKVITLGATKLPFPLMVVGGTRTLEQAYVNYGKGRTAAQCLAGGCPAKYSQPSLARVTSLRMAAGSKHIIQKDGFAHAIDMSPYPYEPQVTPHYASMAAAVKAAAIQLGIHIGWGGDWTSFKDFPHFELV